MHRAIQHKQPQMHTAHLSEINLKVNLSNSRVGKVDEVVSASLLQQRDALQVHLHTIKHFGQVPVVLL